MGEVKMKLFFVNVECEVRNETRMISEADAEKKPYRTFVYAVVAATEREAVLAPENMSNTAWYEIKRYAQNPEGYEVGKAVFQGASDHANKLHLRYAAAV